MIYDIIQELKETSAKNGKIAILQREKDNELLKRVIVATYNPYVQYYIKKIPDYAPNRVATLSLDSALDSLSQLTERKVTGNAAIEYLTKLLENVNEYDAEVLARVVKKSLDCGMTESTANKVWPKLVPTYPCLLAKSVDEKTIKRMTWPAYSQLKADGMRINAHVHNGAVTLRGRSGKTVDLLGELDADILALAAVTQYPESNIVFDGELVVEANDGTIMDRKKGNGILNKAIRGKISQAEAAQVRIRVWDVIGRTAFRNERDDLPYSQRFRYVSEAVEAADVSRVDLIETIEVADIGEAQKHFKAMLKRGEEGTLLKSMDHAWEDKRSYGLLKFKAIKDADLRVIDWIEGTGKYVGKLGALVCQSSDGKVEVSIGSGFSDAQREEFTREATIDKIVEILYNERISDKSRPDVDSLFLPRFVELREDKTVANSSKEIT